MSGSIIFNQKQWRLNGWSLFSACEKNCLHCPKDLRFFRRWTPWLESPFRRFRSPLQKICEWTHFQQFDILLKRQAEGKCVTQHSSRNFSPFPTQVPWWTCWTYWMQVMKLWRILLLFWNTVVFGSKRLEHSEYPKCAEKWRVRHVLNRSRETVQRIEAVCCWQGKVQPATLHPSLDALSSQPLLSVKVKLPFSSQNMWKQRCKGCKTSSTQQGVLVYLVLEELLWNHAGSVLTSRCLRLNVEVAVSRSMGHQVTLWKWHATNIHIEWREWWPAPGFPLCL